MGKGRISFPDALLLAREMNIVSLRGEGVELTRDFLRTMEEVLSQHEYDIAETYSNFEERFLGTIVLSLIFHCGPLKEEELYALSNIVGKIFFQLYPRLEERFIKKGLWVRREVA